VSEAQPGGRDPAPGALALVQAFVNTNDIEGRRDEFATPELMRAWLVERGLLDPDEPVSANDFVRALAVREALRALAAANNGLPLPGDAVETLDRVAAGTLAVHFTTGGGDLNAVRPGLDGVLGRMLAIVLEAMREDSWSRMKACHRDVCRWVFYDHSRNRSSTWCAMSICGNRVKTRSYRRRRAEASASR
jgi:predicted RNA-binding Zn ribbon-like protein